MSVSERPDLGLSLNNFTPTTTSTPIPLPTAVPTPILTPTTIPTRNPAQKVDGPQSALRAYSRWARLADAAAASLAAALAVVVRFGEAPGTYLLLPLVLPAGWLAVVGAHRAYEHRFLGEGPEEFHRITRAGLLMFTAVAMLSYILDGNFSRTIAIISVPATVAGSLLGRRVLRNRLRRHRAAGRGLHRTIVVGHSDAALSLIDSLRIPERGYQHGMLPVGVCIPAQDVTPSHMNGVPVLGTPDDVLAAIDATGADLVAVVSHPDLSGHPLRRLTWALEERGVELLVSPGLVEVAGPRLSIRPIAGLSLVHLERPALRGGRRVLKVAFDVTAGSLLLVALSPLLLTIAALIRLTSPGPALFRQTRVSTNGREFTVYKFRSMVLDAEHRRLQLLDLNEGNGLLFKLRADPRVTRIGRVLRRYSLDELPQLLNVLRGNMSLVGPRPPLPSEVADYGSDEVRRLRVRPGMTGLWQVSGRSDLTWEESLRLDLRYVDNWSLALDLSILCRTVRAVTHGTGAY